MLGDRTSALMKLPLPYTSERRFLVIQYLIGHGLLLLRSNKPDKGSKRIDILFNDVRAMEIRCWFDGIAIEETDESFLANYPSQPLDLMEHGNRIFVLKGKGWTGFILGDVVSYNERRRDSDCAQRFAGECFRLRTNPLWRQKERAGDLGLSARGLLWP